MPGHVAMGHGAVLDFEEVGEVRIDVELDAHVARGRSVVDDRDLLDPHPVDAPAAHHRARRLVLGSDTWSEKERNGEMRLLVHPEQVECFAVDTQRPL